jgi:hypothetical protein
MGDRARGLLHQANKTKNMQFHLQLLRRPHFPKHGGGISLDEGYGGIYEVENVSIAAIPQWENSAT